MGKVIILLVLALLFGGGGLAAGWFLFGKKAETTEAAPPPPPPAPTAKSSDEPGVYVRIGPLILPVIGPQRVEQIVTLVVALEVPDDATADKLRAIVPRLQDAFLQTLYGEFAKGTVLDQGLVNVAEVKVKLGESVAKLVGKDTVRNVLVEVVTQRPV